MWRGPLVSLTNTPPLGAAVELLSVPVSITGPPSCLTRFCLLLFVVKNNCKKMITHHPQSSIPNCVWNAEIVFHSIAITRSTRVEKDDICRRQGTTCYQKWAEQRRVWHLPGGGKAVKALLSLKTILELCRCLWMHLLRIYGAVKWTFWWMFGLCTAGILHLCLSDG